MNDLIDIGVAAQLTVRRTVFTWVILFVSCGYCNFAAFSVALLRLGGGVSADRCHQKRKCQNKINKNAHGENYSEFRTGAMALRFGSGGRAAYINSSCLAAASAFFLTKRSCRVDTDRKLSSRYSIASEGHRRCPLLVQSL